MVLVLEVLKGLADKSVQRPVVLLTLLGTVSSVAAALALLRFREIVHGALNTEELAEILHERGKVGVVCHDAKRRTKR